MIAVIKKIKSIILLIFSLLIVNSCAYMAREIFASKRCKKCDIYNQSGNSVWSEDECGGGVHNMELRGKAAAYDLGCDHHLKCNAYKNDSI